MRKIDLAAISYTPINQDQTTNPTPLKRITRDIDPADVHDLLERVPRACLFFACDDGPHAQPIAFVWRDGRYLVGLPETAHLQPAIDQEVVLLIDEGVHFFDLRAIYIRGHVKPIDAPDDAPAGQKKKPGFSDLIFNFIRRGETRFLAA